ncbi:ricin-type beta-trefoil lectin domain protein [Streptomyces sp. NPDC001288]|uniref:ricin-type beta-trefoil lectin domain protein n=1 Tax=Streptomyces sp. NPDC001297 TaxID=3364559 RepID=UPI0036ABFCD7
MRLEGVPWPGLPPFAPLTHSTWDIGTHGWATSSWDRTPGHSFAPRPGSRTVRMADNAAGTGCTLHETNASYSCVGSRLRPDADRSAAALADGPMEVTYHAKVHRSGGFTPGCRRRALLTTDFIVEDPVNGTAEPDVLSVVRFGPGLFMKKTSGVLCRHEACRTGAGGCRLQVVAEAPMPGDSRTGAVGDAVDALFGKYAHAFMGPDGTIAVHGLCLDRSRGGTADGGPVTLHPCDGTPGQKWVAGRTTQVYNPASGRCLQVARSVDDAPVTSGTCWGGTAQKWWTAAGRG